MKVVQERNSVTTAVFKRFLNASLVIAALLLLIIVFSIATPHFMSITNWFNIFQAVTVVGILAIGQTFVIAAGGIDISQGSVVGLSGVVSAVLMNNGVSIWLALSAGIAVGITVGLVNGLLITVAGIQPFITTLGTMSVASGVALLVTEGQPLFGIPGILADFGSYGILDLLPYMALLMIALAVIAHFLLSQTKFGRYTYAIGSNSLSARLSGLRVRRQLVWVYVISGATSAVGGITLMSWVNSALPSAGSGYELNSIAAVVIGGGSLLGGQGLVFGSVIGALLMSVLSNGSQLLGVSSFWQHILLGIVVLIAVFIDRFRRR